MQDILNQRAILFMETTQQLVPQNKSRLSRFLAKAAGYFDLAMDPSTIILSWLSFATEQIEQRWEYFSPTQKKALSDMAYMHLDLLSGEKDIADLDQLAEELMGPKSVKMAKAIAHSLAKSKGMRDNEDLIKDKLDAYVEAILEAMEREDPRLRVNLKFAIDEYSEQSQLSSLERKDIHGWIEGIADQAFADV